MVETNCSKNMERETNCSKWKVGETNYSKNLASCSKRKVGKTSYNKIKGVETTHGRRHFSRGGKNTSQFVVPPKMALGEGILLPFVGEG